MSPKKKKDHSQTDIVVGNIDSISGEVIIAGRNRNNITIAGDSTTDAPPPAVSKFFAETYRMIEERPNDPNVDKDELKDVILRIETEVREGDSANPARISRWLRFLAEMAPDVFDSIKTAITDPSQSAFRILQKALAGDSTTDAPPPPKKKKDK